MTDIVFVDANGKVVNEMRGVEAILRPDGSESRAQARDA